MTDRKLIQIGEAPAWLQQHGYRVVSRQALHKAAKRGTLRVARTTTVGGRPLRWVKADELVRYVEQKSSGEG